MKRQPAIKDLELCLYCPNLCESRCPVNLAGSNLSWSPWGKMSLAWRLGHGMATESTRTTVPLSMCLDCLACREACDHGINVPENLTAARAAVRRNRTLQPELAESPHNPGRGWELLQKAAPSWRQADDCAALLVLGHEMLQEDSAEQLESLFAALDRMGDQVLGVNRDSVLECGHLSYALGDPEGASNEARAAFARWGKYNRIVIASPHCLSFVRMQWPEMGFDRTGAVQSLPEHLFRLQDQHPGKFVASRIAYFDSCHLGRHLGQFQIPRDVIKWTLREPLVELVHNNKQATCCGGGYPLSQLSENSSREIAGMVLEEFENSQADVLVCACSQCVRNLSKANPKARVVHLVDLLSGKVK